MPLLILVKHSLPEIVKDVAASAWHLSETGRARAERLAERLAVYQPGVLVSSGEPKAVETAQIMAGRLQLPVQVVSDLHEHERSMVPYLSSEAFEESVRAFFAQPDRLVFGSETADQAHQRFSNAICSFLDEHRHKTAVIVSHGTVISLFVSRLTGVADFVLWKELGLPGFVVLDMNSKKQIDRENIL